MSLLWLTWKPAGQYGGGPGNEKKILRGWRFLSVVDNIRTPKRLSQKQCLFRWIIQVSNAGISMATPACNSEGICSITRHLRTIDHVIWCWRCGAQTGSLSEALFSKMCLNIILDISSFFLNTSSFFLRQVHNGKKKSSSSSMIFFFPPAWP